MCLDGVFTLRSSETSLMLRISSLLGSISSSLSGIFLTCICLCSGSICSGSCTSSVLKFGSLAFDCSDCCLYLLELSAAREAIGTVFRNFLWCFGNLSGSLADGIGSTLSLTRRGNSTVLFLCGLYNRLLRLFVRLFLFSCYLLGFLSLNLFVALYSLDLLLPGCPLSILLHLDLFKSLPLCDWLFNGRLMFLSLFSSGSLSLVLFLRPDSFAPLSELFLMLNPLWLLFLVVIFPLLLLSDSLKPLFLDQLFSVSLFLFAPDACLLNALLSDLLSSDALIFSFLLCSLVLNSARFGLLRPFFLLLLIFSLSGFFDAFGLLNRNAPSFFFFDPALLNFFLSLDADGFWPLALPFFSLFNEFALVLLRFRPDWLLILLLSDALFLFPLAVVCLPVVPGVVLLVWSPDVILLLIPKSITSILLILVLLVFVFLRIVCISASGLSTGALASCLRELWTGITIFFNGSLLPWRLLFRLRFADSDSVTTIDLCCLLDRFCSRRLLLRFLLVSIGIAFLSQDACIVQGEVSAKLVEGSSRSGLLGGKEGTYKARKEHLESHLKSKFVCFNFIIFSHTN